MLIDEICKKAGQKLNDLSRVKPYIDLSERLMMVNTLSLTQFSYCPSVWMCHSRTKNKINCLYERCQRPVHNGKQIIMNYWKGMVLYCSVYTKTKPELLQLQRNNFFKGRLLHLRQFPATGSPLKIMKMQFFSPEKLFTFLRSWGISIFVAKICSCRKTTW